jgi:hypothetical protein
MRSVLTCYNVAKHTKFYLGYLWLTNPYKKNPGVLNSGNEVAMLPAPLYQSIHLGNGCWGTRALLQGNEGVLRLAGSEYVLFGHLRLTVEWGTFEHAQIHDSGNGRMVGNGHLVPRILHPWIFSYGDALNIIPRKNSVCFATLCQF